jgi:hypothetical protein
MKNLYVTAPVLGLVMLALLGTAHAGGPTEGKLSGKTYGEWSASWWQWQEANFPNFEFGEGLVDCSVGQSPPVWFLGGTGGGGAARECQEPLGNQIRLFIPLVNVSFYNPDGNCPEPNFTCTIEEKREILDGLFSEVPAGIYNSVACDLQIDVDGTPAVLFTPIVRTQSPPFDYAGDPETIADGYWVMLDPLPSGEHEIVFSGGLCDIETGESLVRVDVTYIVMVEGEDDW